MHNSAAVYAMHEQPDNATQVIFCLDYIPTSSNIAKPNIMAGIYPPSYTITTDRSKPMALRLISQIVFFYILLFPVPYKLDYKEAQFSALQICTAK